MSQFRKRPTFEEVANKQTNKYKIDLPQRTYIRWEDTHARVQFDNFRDATAEAELTRARRQAVQAGVMGPPATTRARGRDAPPTAGPDQTLLTTGEPAQQPEQSTGKGKKKKLTTDNVMRHTSDADDDMGDPDAASSNRRLRSSKSDAGQSTPEDTNRGSGPDGRGGGGSAGEGTKVTAH